MEFLFAFPFNTLWGLAILFLFHPKLSLSLFWSLAFLLVGASFFFGDAYTLQFWFPGDMGVVLFASLISVKLLFPTSSSESSNLPTTFSASEKRLLKNKIEAIADFNERRKKYFESILTIAKFWQAKDNRFTRFNTVSLFLILVTVFLLPFSILTIDYFSENKIQQIVTNSVTLFLESLTKEVRNKIVADEMIDSIFFYAPTLMFFINSISVLLMLKLMREVIRRKKVPFIPLGDLSLISLSDYMIWPFLLSAIGVAGASVLGLSSTWLFIPLNLSLIFAFIFALQGLGILHLFMEIRLFPTTWIYLALALGAIPFGLVIIPSVLLLAFLIGATNFWFSFRKKALQPKLEINSDTLL